MEVRDLETEFTIFVWSKKTEAEILISSNPRLLEAIVMHEANSNSLSSKAL